MKSDNNRNSLRDGLDVERDHSGSMENDWSMLEQRLDRYEKRGNTMLWTKVLSAAAAVLLLLLGWWLFQPQDAVKPEQEIAKEKPIPSSPDSQPARGEGVIPGNEKNNSFQAKNKDAETRYTENQGVEATENKEPELIPAQGQNRLQSIDQNPVPAIFDARTAFKSNLDEQHVVVKLDSLKTTGLPLQSEKVTKAKLGPRSPQLSLSVIYAPAINGVNNFSNAKVGSDVGLLLTVGLTKKISVTTGAIYAKKLYESSFSEYNPVYKPSLAFDPESVYADCRVLDIPLNINYSLLNKGKNSLTVGTGLSSYLMLKEDYRYVYPTNYNNPAYNYSLSNRNKHWFGVVNLEARYQRQISPKFGIGLQPYIKIPISDIGYGNVKLQSLGMAVNFNWNIRAASKKDQ